MSSIVALAYKHFFLPKLSEQEQHVQSCVQVKETTSKDAAIVTKDGKVSNVPFQQQIAKYLIVIIVGNVSMVHVTVHLDSKEPIVSTRIVSIPLAVVVVSVSKVNVSVNLDSGALIVHRPMIDYSNIFPIVTTMVTLKLKQENVLVSKDSMATLVLSVSFLFNDPLSEINF